MAGDVVIRAERLGKKYIIGHIGERYVTLRDQIARGARDICRKTADVFRGRTIVSGDTTEEFWALKDVSFEVERGEVLGIIGRNGAGKSTLLKILSRITEPSAGRVAINGRVATLLEVGTGFHPELTGRENVYLNGAILGMGRGEIRRRFDEIVAFAEIEKFLDTPVKRYSSGMYVRLAFAVAAHLEPEIMIVDEVLAVGDGAFQKKCLGKLKNVSGASNRTVLFVSHNMNAVASICHRAILLEAGKVAAAGLSAPIVSEYLKQSVSSVSVKKRTWDAPQTAPGNDQIRVRRICVTGANPNGEISYETPISIEIHYWNFVPHSRVRLCVELYAHGNGNGVLEDWSVDGDNWKGPLPVGLFKTVCKIPGQLLNHGIFSVNIIFFDAETVRPIYEWKEAAIFEVHDIAKRAVSWNGRFIGNVHPKLRWNTTFMGCDQLDAPNTLVESTTE